jgi:hypothetical protein
MTLLPVVAGPCPPSLVASPRRRRQLPPSNAARGARGTYRRRLASFAVLAGSGSSSSLVSVTNR